MLQKILLSATLLHDPESLLLDDPLSGLDVETSILFKDLDYWAPQVLWAALNSEPQDWLSRVSLPHFFATNTVKNFSVSLPCFKTRKVKLRQAAPL